jgi:two-component system alkaline phosphatase synthesis response regulator PhoP
MLNRRGRVLIVEDDVKTSETVALYLRHAGYDVAQCFDGQEALEKAQIWEPDLVVLDLMLPKMSGLDVCARLRARGDVSIIMLTAKTTEADRLHGLESGADDYVSKPFSPRELAARVKAVMRRRSSHVLNAPVTFGEITVDGGTRDARVNGTALKLTPTEFDMLLALCRRPRIVRTRDELIAEVIGYDYDGTERTIDVHVRNLRRKIADAGGRHTHIRAVFGSGYKIESDA